jgi:ElaA protein
MKINWDIKKFEELTSLELYIILKLRAEVFIVEQNCPYQDLDGKDLRSLHLIGMNELNELVAYARLLPQHISYPEASIGRVVSSPNYRKTGLGKELMKKALEVIYEKFGNSPIRIGAQLYLKDFYESLGFVKISDEYLEDNIPHIEMLKNFKNK